MTNHRRRMQTRNRRISANTPWWSYPDQHNAAVARRKQHRAMDRRRTELLHAARRVRTTLRDLGQHLANIGAVARVAIRNFAAEYNTLDRLASNGYDVREEHDALAAEEAEMNRHTKENTDD